MNFSLSTIILGVLALGFGASWAWDHFKQEEGLSTTGKIHRRLSLLLTALVIWKLYVENS